MGIMFWLFLAVIVAVIVVLTVISRRRLADGTFFSENTARWKTVGLWFSLAWEILFWILYLSSLLVKIGSPFLANLLWLGGGAAGIIFGTVNLIGGRKKHIKVLALADLLSGIPLLLLWVLAMFVTTM